MKNNIVKFILVFLLLSCNMMFLLPISIWNTLRILSLLVVSINFINPNIFLKSKGKFNVHIALFIVLCLVEIIISKVAYNQEMLDIVVTVLYCFSIVIYFIINYFWKVEMLDYLKKIFIYISLVLSIILIAQMILYENFSLKFLNINFENRLRFGEVRIEVGAYLICIGSIIAFSEIISNKCKNKKIYIITFCLDLIYIVYVSKTRGYLVALLIPTMSMLFISMRGITRKFKFTIIIIFTSILFMNLPIMEKYKALEKNDEGSTWVRKKAIEFYIEQIKEKPLFGMGIINVTDSNDDNYSLIRGPYNKFYREDIGIIGFTNGFGIIGLALYISIIYRVFKIIIYNFKSKIIYDNLYKFGLFVFLCITTPTLICLDPERIYYLAFILILIEKTTEKSKICT